MRCSDVHECFVAASLEAFRVWRLPLDAFHPKYTHPRILIYLFLPR
jgi:hypothetical protein